MISEVGISISEFLYDYDIDGNVKTLWQQIAGLTTPTVPATLKRLDYEYDLISGKVNVVRYQQGQNDQFFYAYDYDAENRLTKAWSGIDAITDPYTNTTTLLHDSKRLDAAYQYYLHGPLARMELGDIHGKVQGVDYAYTLQGWLKGVNAASLQGDMGNDGPSAGNIGKDAFAYSLGYYNGDYTHAGASVTRVP